MARSAGIAVVLGAVLLSGCGLGMQDLPVGRSVGGDSYAVQLQLATAAGLVLGAEVRAGQQVIGRVAAMETDAVGAKVTLSLNSAVPLARDVHASLELPSALGNPFIRLVDPDPGAGEQAQVLRAGDVIEQRRTDIGPQIESTLAALGMVVNGSGMSQMQVVVEELNTAFGGRSGEVRGLTTTMRELFGQAAANQDDFDEAIVLAARISEQFVNQQQVLDGFLDTVPAAVEALGRQRDTISSLLDSSTQLAANANTILAGSPHGLDQMLGDATSVIGALGAFNDRIGEALGNMNTFIDNFETAARGDYLMFDGALDIPETLRTLWLGPAAPATPSPEPLLSIENLLPGGGR
ncbi:MlaD family protein [Tomitella biformata]|uniref:MlaD family protein n=1 Tax=Tomitella biformata TaxID=630403 RepID=UPI000463FDFD|nr:MlaD family protein [Tomitella biformata]